jgi:hypothetical protein
MESEEGLDNHGYGRRPRGNLERLKQSYLGKKYGKCSFVISATKENLNRLRSASLTEKHFVIYQTGMHYRTHCTNGV